MLCFGLAGIAVGFGAWFPNPREDSPSRLAAGFGGTMTLVVSTLYILILVLMTALPTHFRLTAPHGAAARAERRGNRPDAPGGLHRTIWTEENFSITCDYRWKSRGGAASRARSCWARWPPCFRCGSASAPSDGWNSRRRLCFSMTRSVAVRVGKKGQAPFAGTAGGSFAQLAPVPLLGQPAHSTGCQTARDGSDSAFSGRNWRALSRLPRACHFPERVFGVKGRLANFRLGEV